MQMLFDSRYNKAAVDFCKTLDGHERTKFMVEAYEDYLFSVEQKSPRIIQRQFRELFSRLVKNFGH